jgi:hypothetical protein
VREEEVGIGVRIGVGGVGEVGGGGRRWRGGAAANLTSYINITVAPCYVYFLRLIQGKIHPVVQVSFTTILMKFSEVGPVENPETFQTLYQDV